MKEYVFAKSGKYQILQNFGFGYPVKRRVVNMGEKNMPDYNVIVGTKSGDKTFWTKIGSAWKKDDKISVNLNALPVGNSMLLVTPDKKEAERK